MAKKKKLQITLLRSVIGRHFKQKRTVKALGLRRLNHSVLHTDSPQIRGMLNKVSHLVKVEEK
ncbi:MAG: 50S ribosomal protein L30 [bacterium]